LGRKGGKCFQDVRKSNFTAKCLNTFVAHCAVPENIHTPPTEGIGISWGVGVLEDQKI